MKKVKVNQDACIGCGACVAIDPAHFDFNDDGLSHAINQDNLESEELMNAISSCPTCAISVEEAEECNCNSDCDCGCQEGKECTCEECDCGEDTCECDGCCCHCEEE